jgi:uncharacterized membrane protein
LSDRRLRGLAALFAGAGIAIAGYLSWAHYADASVVCPVGGGGCEAVQSSEYSEVAGVAVAVLGLAAYAAILALLAWDSPLARLLAAALALVGAIFSGYLLIVQLFVIDAICAWCLVNDVVVAPGLAVLTALRLRSWELDEEAPA